MSLLKQLEIFQLDRVSNIYSSVLLGFQAQNADLEDESTVLIDAEKFLQIFKDSNDRNECSENEVFQECGGKCVLSCRFASSALGITLSKEECEKTECVKGCFCKDGLVRHGEKCIPATECSAQKGRTDKMLESREDQASFGPFARIFGMFRCGSDGCAPNVTPYNARGMHLPLYLKDNQMNRV